MRRSLHHALAFSIQSICLLHCAHETIPPAEKERAEYRIGREDVVEVEVWKDPALSAKVPVRPDGKISLPMVGELRAEGRTTSELQKEITAHLQNVVNDPVVSVMLSEINATKFFVLGEVVHPGAYPVRGTMSILQGLAVAGGLTEFATRRSIVVIRPGPAGKEQRFHVNYDRVASGRSPSVQLYSGDTIYVP
jgi:polysaccharide export outer membrane protein